VRELKRLRLWVLGAVDVSLVPAQFPAKNGLDSGRRRQMSTFQFKGKEKKNNYKLRFLLHRVSTKLYSSSGVP
jgi:hypothetical protein